MMGLENTEQNAISKGHCHVDYITAILFDISFTTKK